MKKIVKEGKSMQDHLTAIYQSIKQLHESGGMGNFVTFVADEEKNYYVQATGEKEGDTIYTEAVSNNALSPAYRLNEIKLTHLKSLGWIEPKNEDGNFYKDWSINSDSDRKQVANFLLKTLEEVYNFTDNDALSANVVLE